MTWLSHQSHRSTVMFTDDEAFDETTNEWKCIPLDDIMCIHQRLDPNMMDNFKRLSEVRTLLNCERAGLDLYFSMLVHKLLRTLVTNFSPHSPQVTSVVIAWRKHSEARMFDFLLIKVNISN